MDAETSASCLGLSPCACRFHQPHRARDTQDTQAMQAVQPSCGGAGPLVHLDSYAFSTCFVVSGSRFLWPARSIGDKPFVLFETSAKTLPIMFLKSCYRLPRAKSSRQPPQKNGIPLLLCEHGGEVLFCKNAITLHEKMKDKSVRTDPLHPSCRSELQEDAQQVVIWQHPEGKSNWPSRLADRCK